MREVPARMQTVWAGERGVRRMRKHVMGSERTVRTVDERRPIAVRNVEMRARSADPRVRRKVRYATAADMSREMWGTSSTMGGKMRRAADMGSKVRAAANMRGKMRRAATYARSATRASAAGVSATAGPRRGRAGTSRQAQA
jgi:hypothetical protein